jgi:transposase
LILSLHSGTGGGADHPHFAAVLFDAWRRTPGKTLRKVVADAGYDSEAIHCIARQDMDILSIIPPLSGRHTHKRPSGRWRRWMKRLLRTKRARRRCGYTQRWQVETVNSMIKRRLGSFCRGKSPLSRQRDLRLKALVHNLMILRRTSRVETEQVRAAL